MDFKVQIKESLVNAQDAQINSKEWKKVATAAIKDAKQLAKFQKKVDPDFNFDAFVASITETLESIDAAANPEDLDIASTYPAMKMAENKEDK